MKSLSLTTFLAIALPFVLAAQSSDRAENKKLKSEEKRLVILSDPAGAHVFINGRERGVTPLELPFGPWAYETRKSTAMSRHLTEPMTLQIAAPGFKPETIEITRGPFHWVSMNRTNRYDYWVINSPVYNVHLKPASRPLNNADVIALFKSGLGEQLVIDKIGTSSCEFKMDPEDIVYLRGAGLTDPIISAMMHAVPAPDAPTAK